MECKDSQYPLTPAWAHKIGIQRHLARRYPRNHQLTHHDNTEQRLCITPSSEGHKPYHRPDTHSRPLTFYCTILCNLQVWLRITTEVGVAEKRMYGELRQTVQTRLVPPPFPLGKRRLRRQQPCLKFPSLCKVINSTLYFSVRQCVYKYSVYLMLLINSALSGGLEQLHK